jgi:cell wall-associated NlpC family hydrolase
MIEYIGKSYKAFSRGPDSFDCCGLVMDIYSKTLGITLTDHAYSNTHEFRDNAIIYNQEESAKVWDKIQSPKLHDLVVFNIGGYPVHVGVMIDSKRFIHAHESCGIAIESVESVKWRNRINGYYRHRDSV